MKEIYVDNAATTPVDPRVLAAMEPYFSEHCGNPGSMNNKGQAASDAVNHARETIANILGCTAPEIIFTGSGTESINLALQGIARVKKKGHIITQTTEHPAVFETLSYLKKEGFEITEVKVNREGLVNPEDIKNAIKDDTILVTIMYANNEIGTIQPIKEIAAVCKEKKIPFHTDACQATCSLNLKVDELGVDLMSINSSKVYGPKGVGVLYIRRNTRIKPLVFGGGQEFKMRSGTENVPGIVGFAKALELAHLERDKENERLTNLRDYLIKELLEKTPKSFLNGHPTQRLPNNANITFLDIEGEAILLKLNEEHIYASTGSACSSANLKPSHVIVSLGVPYEVAHGSIRFSLGRFTTKEDVDLLIEKMVPIILELKDISPLDLSVKEVLA